MRQPVRLATLCLIAAATIAVEARQASTVSALQAQIDRIFKTRDYSAPRFGPARWLPDGTAYAIVEDAGTGSEIVRYEAGSTIPRPSIRTSRRSPIPRLAPRTRRYASEPSAPKAAAPRSG